jgi:hypothetical protein
VNGAPSSWSNRVEASRPPVWHSRASDRQSYASHVTAGAPSAPLRPTIFDYIPTTLLTTYRVDATRFASSLMRGVSGDVLRRSGEWRPGTAVQPRPGGWRDPNGFGLAAGPREVVAWAGGTVGHMTRGRAAENRHGGAPRGAVPVARDGPRLASAVSRLASATGLPSAPFGAPPTPRSGVGTKRKENPAQKRATE